jgi:hypothetical protein
MPRARASLAVAVVLLTGLATAAVASDTAPSLIARDLTHPGLRYPELTDVACTSPSFCLATGTYGSGAKTQGLAEFWNGHTWRQDAPEGVGAVACLSASYCLSAGDALAGGRLSARRWNGRAWSPVAIYSPPDSSSYEPEDIDAVACVSRSDCWAVGFIQAGTTSSGTLIERWNGTRWVRSTAPVISGAFDSVSCTSADACLAVGSVSLTGGPPAEYFNGQTWTVLPLPGDWNTSAPLAISCTSAAACWVVGSTADNGPMAMRRLNGSWQAMSLPSTRYAEVTLSGVACSPSGLCWAVGQNTPNVPGQTKIQTRLFAEEWNGSEWRLARFTGASGTIEYLAGVACPPGGACVAVGSVGSQGNSSPLVASPG